MSDFLDLVEEVSFSYLRVVGREEVVEKTVGTPSARSMVKGERAGQRGSSSSRQLLTYAGTPVVEHSQAKPASET